MEKTTAIKDYKHKDNGLGKVVLINLPVKTYKKDEIEVEYGYNPSMSLLSIATWLEFNGYAAEIIDLCLEKKTLEELVNEVLAADPILVGLSVYTVNVESAIVLAKALKRRNSEIKVLAGGPHPSLAYEDMMESEFIDFMILKEGEAPLLELLEAINSREALIKYEDIPGLVYKRNNSAEKNALRQPIRDLNILPIIKRELYNFEKYKDIITIHTSRGCPGKCIYCAGSALTGVKYRMRDIENVILEIVYLSIALKDRFSQIYIIDDTFTAFPDRVDVFVELVKKYKLDMSWRFQSRVDVMTESLLDKVASIGCIQILYGIESGSQEVLDKIRKNINLEHARKVIELTHKKKIIPEISFMIGHYCDTIETMNDTYNFIKEMGEKYYTEILLSYNVPFPGTYQFVHRDKLGIKIKESNYSLFNGTMPIVETSEFSINDQRIIYDKARKYLWKVSKTRYFIRANQESNMN